MIFIVPHDMPASQDHFNTPKKLTIGFNFKIVKMRGTMDQIKHQVEPHRLDNLLKSLGGCVRVY